jgi:serine/alanine adding enzyme
MIDLTYCTREHEPSWDDYVRSHPDATYCHLSGWRDVFRETYGHKDHYLIARDGATIVGVLPLFHLRGFVSGGSLISMPFLDCGGALAESADVEKHLLLKAVNLGKSVDAGVVELRHTQPPRWVREITETETDDPADLHYVAGGLPCLVRSHKVRMLLTLPDNSDALMASFKSKLRSQIKRPIKEGCEASIGGAELVDEFYGVFAVNMRDLGSPVHSRRLFLKIFEKFPSEARIALVRKGRKAIAASLVIGFGNTLSNPWASSLKEYGQLSPNMLLYWTKLGYACEKGFGYFDFGRSSPGEGTFRFKEQWGAQPCALNWNVLLLDGRSKTDDRPEKSRFATAISCWKRLPVPLTRIIGPMVRKRIGL